MTMAVAVTAPSMAATKDAAGTVPVRRLAKDELVNTHKSHLTKQDDSPHAARAVKQPVMSEAYPASTKSIRDLEIVSHPLSREIGITMLTWASDPTN
jgi:hypothetical protein